MPLTFYMTPGSCSTGIHLLLERSGLPFQVTVLNLPQGDHRAPAYLALNPKATIPALQLDDGQVLTEFGAIAYWIAARCPRAKLWPEDPLQAARVVELVEHVVGSVHGQGYTRIFTPEAYETPLVRSLPADARTAWREELAVRGRELVVQHFEILDAKLPEAGGPAVGAHFGVADAALFYVAFWAEHLKLPLPPRIAAHLQWMRTQAVVRQVLAEEGYRV